MVTVATPTRRGTCGCPKLLPTRWWCEQKNKHFLQNRSFEQHFRLKRWTSSSLSATAQEHRRLRCLIFCLYFMIAVFCTVEIAVWADLILPVWLDGKRSRHLLQQNDNRYPDMIPHAELFRNLLFVFQCKGKFSWSSDAHFHQSPVIGWLKSQKTDCSNPHQDLGLIEIKFWWFHVPLFSWCWGQAFYCLPTEFKPQVSAKDRGVEKCIWTAWAPCSGWSKQPRIVHGQFTLCLYKL